MASCKTLKSAVDWRTSALIVALALHVVTAAIALYDAPQPQSDFDRYYEIAGGVGRPYVDYQVEHPIGTLMVFKLLAAVPGGRPSFGRGVVTVNAIADAVVIWALSWAWGTPAAAFYAVVSLPMAGLLFRRIDLWSMSAATLAVAGWRRQLPTLSAASLAVGASFKLWPLVLIFALWRTDNRRRALTVFVLVAGALAGAALLLAGRRAILEVLTFRGATGWQIESVAGSLIHLMSATPARLESGAWRIGTIGRLTSISLFAAAAPVCIWASWRGFRANRPGTAWLAAVGALLTLSALFSAQYAAWIIPGGALAWAEGNQRSSTLTAAVVFLTQLFMSAYDSVIGGAIVMVALVVLRNLVLGALTLDALLTLGRTSLAEPHLQP